MREFLLILALGALAGCTGFGHAYRAAMVSNDGLEYVEPDPRPDQALIYFYGANQFAYGSLIYEGGLEVAVIEPAAFTYIFADPGRHTYTARLSGEASATIDAQAGEVYYLRFSAERGFWDWRPYLERVSAETGEAAIPGLQYVVLNLEHDPARGPMGRRD